MLSTEEALALATRDLDDSYDARVTDFDAVCVVEFTRQLPHTGQTPGDSLATTAGDASITDAAIDASIRGPLLIDKRSGQIFEIGNNPAYTLEDCAACYLATGSPRGRPAASVIVRGPSDAADNDVVVDSIATATEAGAASTRMRLKQLGLAGRVEIETPSAEAASTLADSLRALGVDAQRNWISEDAGIVPDSQLFEIDDTDITVDFDEFTREEK